MMDPKSLRRAFGSFMSGVTIVATRDSNDSPIGFTANSFSSVSLEPPLLLVCPAKSLSSFDIFDTCSHFHVSVLAHDQKEISNTFASSSEDRFSKVDWRSDLNGCPQIDGAIAHFSCRRERSIDAGDHIILLGEVTQFDFQENHGLGYDHGGYFSLDMERRAAELENTTHSETRNLRVGALVEHRGKVLLITDHSDVSKVSLPQIDIADEQPSFDAIQMHLTELLAVNVNVGSVFSIFDHSKGDKSSIYYRVAIEDGDQPNVEAGQFYSVSDLPKQSYSSGAIQSIMNRYINERQTGNHSLYIGTEKHGRTHKIRGRKL